MQSSVGSGLIQHSSFAIGPFCSVHQQSTVVSWLCGIAYLEEPHLFHPWNLCVVWSVWGTLVCSFCGFWILWVFVL